MTTDDAVSKLADEYDKSREIGQKYISSAWKQLTTAIKDRLVATGHYSSNGGRSGNEDCPCDVESEVESLEYQLGKLKACADCKLPSRTDKNAQIGYEAVTDDIRFTCDEILYKAQWHDPWFIRLGLRAISKQQMANLWIPAPKTDRFIEFKAVAMFVAGLLCMVLVYASPYFVGDALVSATKGNLGDTVLACYVLGFTWWLHELIKNITTVVKPETQDAKNETAFNTWVRLDCLMQPLYTTGAGLKVYLEKMVMDGIEVPPIAFDLCSALEHCLFNPQNKPA